MQLQPVPLQSASASSSWPCKTLSLFFFIYFITSSCFLSEVTRLNQHLDEYSIRKTGQLEILGSVFQGKPMAAIYPRADSGLFLPTAYEAWF